MVGWCTRDAKYLVGNTKLGSRGILLARLSHLRRALGGEFSGLQFGGSVRSSSTPAGQTVRSAGAHVCFVPFADIGLHPYLVRFPPPCEGVWCSVEA